MTDLRNRMLGLFMAGWLRVRSVAHPVHRGRESAAGHAAALTVRRLSALLGNALVTEMRSLGFEQLLILLSSPEWLESRISQRARSIAFEVQPDERESWARPQSIDEGGNDSDLRGVPGGAARRAVELFRREGLTVVSASPGIRQTVQWQALEEGSRAFARPASNIVGSLEVLVEYGGRVKARSRARQALLQEYGAELRWLETTEGQQAIAGRRLEYPLVEIQDFGAVAAGLQDAI